MNYMEERRLRKLGLAEPLSFKKKRTPIAKKSTKKLAEEKAEKDGRVGGETELQKWYAGIMEGEEAVCWETGERIDKRDTMGWQGSIAHVLDKKNFPSVKTHPMNYMILKMWGGTHGQYDSSWENASKMIIWPLAVQIINILYPLLTKEEKRKLPEIILQELEPK